MRNLFNRWRRKDESDGNSVAGALTRGAEWKQVCQSLVAPTLKWIDAQPRAGAKALDQAVASVICETIPDLPKSASDWCQQLLLDSPAIIRLLRIRLLDRLTQIGVYRDFSDLPSITSYTPACLLAAVRVANGGDAEPIWSLARNTLSAFPTTRPTASDAFLLSELLVSEELQAIRNPREVSPMTDLVELAVWLAGLNTGKPTKMPASDLTRAWLSTTAFRGARRSWCRKMGENAGAHTAIVVPEGLKPMMPRLSEAYGSMVVEWTLAAIRCWPDRGQLADYAPEILKSRVAPLIAEVRSCLATVENGDQLNKWLSSSIDLMIRSDDDDWSQAIHFGRSPSIP